MTGVVEERLHRLVEELDRLVPRDGARVRLEQYGGGPDEGRIVANQAGYLRFGTELLKAGLLPSNPQEAGLNSVAIDLKYLVTDDSIIGFDEFIRDESLSDIRQPRRFADNLVGIAMGVGCLAVVIFAVVGVITVIGWF
jgi:hypothetical protein